MSFLCEEIKIHNTSFDKPSPTCKKGFCLNRFSCKANKFTYAHIGRISQFSSFRFMRGSMTVEASIVLPLFLFFFLHMAGFIEMLRLHSNLEYGLWKTGKILMMYGAAEEIAQVVPDVAVSYVYVKYSLEGSLGEEYLDSSPLRYGSDGLNFLGSDILTEKGEVDIVVTYEVRPPITIFPYPYVRMVNRFYGKAWTGYDVTKSGTQKEVAYITRYGEVWHTTKTCSHLKISVKEILAEDLESYKNAWGQAYDKCAFCVDGTRPARIFLSAEGDCYHYQKGCQGLIRHVEEIDWKERENYRPCSRCVGA